MLEGKNLNDKLIVPLLLLILIGIIVFLFQYSKGEWSDKLAIIAIIISVFSAIVAYLPFHYQYIRKTHDVKATILNFLVGNSPESQFISEITFINNGNQPCAIVKVSAFFRNIDTVKQLFQGTSDINCINQIPFTIKPDEVIIKQYLFGQGEPKDCNYTEYAKTNEQINFGIVFSVIDSLGKYHEIEMPICYLTIGEGGKKYLDNFPKTVILLPSDCKENYRASFPLRHSQNKNDNFLGK